MAQNITLLGAQYNDVPAVQLPKTGGGTARFDDTSITTAVASDVTQGKLFLAADGTITTGTNSGGGGGSQGGDVWQDQDGYVHLSDEEGGGSVTVESLSVTQNGTYTAPTGKAYSPVTVNVSGGGGASNIVTGTFTGTTTGAAMDVALNYTGTGYPIAVVIFPIEGSYNTSSSFYSLLQRYVISQYVMTKIDNTAPTYSTSGNNNGGTVQLFYKNSASDITNYGRAGSTNQNIYSGSNASSSNNLLTVRFKSATTMSVFIASTSSYGFAANYEYKYCVIYSS